MPHMPYHRSMHRLRSQKPHCSASPKQISVLLHNPSPAEIDVELCPVSKQSQSLSFRFGKPLIPPYCRRSSNPSFLSGQDLVCIRLMSHIPDQFILWQVQYQMQRHRKLHNTQIGCQMSSGSGLIFSIRNCRISSGNSFSCSHFSFLYHLPVGSYSSTIYRASSSSIFLCISRVSTNSCSENSFLSENAISSSIASSVIRLHIFSVPVPVLRSVT